MTQHKDNCKKKKKEKEICEAIAATMPAGMKALHFLWNTYLISNLNATFMRVQDFCKKGISMDSNMTWEKVKSLYDNLRQKEIERSKAGEFNASKRWFDNFRKSLALKNVKITGEAAFANQEAADEFPRCH